MSLNKKMRMHQSDLKKIADTIIAGKTLQNKFTIHACPGSGKSKLSSIFTNMLFKAGLIERVVWVCPRNSLVSQAVSGFKDVDFNPEYSIRAGPNSPPLFRDVNLGNIGYSTTYQSISSQPDLHFQTLKPFKYLLILDEPHHLSDDSDDLESLWTKAIAPLVEMSSFCIMMTGTMERWDQKKIPFIEYTEEGDRFFPKKDIFYSRTDALIEKAIVPMDFYHVSGFAEYIDDEGKHKINSAEATEKEISKVIQTLLSKFAYRDSLLKQGLDSWVLSRNQYKSRAIVICATQDMAESVSEQIKTMYKGVQVALAISREGAESQETIKKFRKNDYGHVLVTVGMAYEGLDVPDCKTLICLTDTRSIPWLEQAFARVTRVDYKAIAAGITYEQQRASIYVPDDPKMRAIVDYFEDEQDRGLKAKKEKEAQLEEEEKEKGDRKVPGASFTSLGAESIGTTTSVLGLSLDDTVTLLPEAEDEKDVRRKIEMYARRRDVIKRLPRGSTNKLVYSQFGKPRNKMGLSELNKVLNYLISLTR